MENSPMETEQIENSLRETVFDAVAKARHSIRVGNAKPDAEDETRFFVSFMLTLELQNARCVAGSR